MTVQDDERLAGQAMEAGAYEEAVRLLRPLAERNSEYALLALGWIYETGAVGTPDQDAARAFYEHAAAQGSAAGYRSLGRVLLNGGQEIEARAAFERGAELDSDECKSELARLADHADEKLASQALKRGAYEEAVRWLRPLADRNSEYALLWLGLIFERGLKGPPDKETACSYYERAASQGSAAAYCHLGQLLSEQGKQTEARSAFQAGAERGHAPSMSRLGWTMVNGRGGSVELDAGTAWLKKAAAKGHIFAQIQLLAIEERNTKSIFKKLLLRVKRVAPGLKWLRERLKDPA